MQWLLKYEITQQDVDNYNIGWNNEHQMLVLVNTPSYYQARNFSNYGAKYLSKGHKPLIFYGNGAILVCVEDILSAIKIAKANKNVTDERKDSPTKGQTINLATVKGDVYYWTQVKLTEAAAKSDDICCGDLPIAKAKPASCSVVFAACVSVIPIICVKLAICLALC